MDNDFLSAAEKQRFLRFAAKATGFFVCLVVLITLAAVFRP